MPSFDIVSKVDAQLLDNAVNVTRKEITNRFDFKDSHVVIDLDKKEYKLKLETADDMKMQQLIDVLINRSNKQGISPEAFDLSKEAYPSGKTVKKEVSVRNGLKQEDQAPGVQGGNRDVHEVPVRAARRRFPLGRVVVVHVGQS